MTNFHFAKIIAGVGPILAKETILSKIINMVDVFRISLSQGFDDNNKKYIETILKLDNSKTIMFETKGNDLRVKNIFEVEVKKGQKIVVDYSEYAQENITKLFVDYSMLGELPKGTMIRFEQSDIIAKIIKTQEDYAECEIQNSGIILQYDRVIFDNYELDIPFLTNKDKKDILRGLEHGIHMIAGSYVRSAVNISELKAFLFEQNQPKLKVFAKIETNEAIQNIDEIIEISDGIILVVDRITKFLKDNSISKDEIFQKCKESSKPIIVTYVEGLNTDEYALFDDKNIKHLCDMVVDGFMIETIINEEDPLNIITKVSDLLEKHERSNESNTINNLYEETEFIVRDYIIYNAYRITKELEIKAIVCFTDNGYTTSRLSALNTSVPIIAFTKSDETYRYLNILKGVRGYKISQSFNYENLKRIGKEMIRIIFKGNISLDDKIIIVQANEITRDEKTDMINGVELYKFKNI